MPKQIEIVRNGEAVQMVIRGYDVAPQPGRPAQWDLHVALSAEEVADLVRDLTAATRAPGD